MRGDTERFSTVAQNRAFAIGVNEARVAIRVAMERNDELSRKLDNVLHELEMKSWRACDRIKDDRHASREPKGR